MAFSEIIEIMYVRLGRFINEIKQIHRPHTIKTSAQQEQIGLWSKKRKEYDFAVFVYPANMGQLRSWRTSGFNGWDPVIGFLLARTHQLLKHLKLKNAIQNGADEIDQIK